MQKKHNQIAIALILGVASFFGCYFHSNTLLNTNKSVKILINGLEKINHQKNIQVHISGVNLDVNEDLHLSNYFSFTETYHNVNELMKGLEIQSGKLSQGKWRIAIELIGWKTACSTFIEEGQNPQIVFSYQKQLCP